MVITDFSTHLGKKFINYAKGYAKKIIEIIRNPEVDTKLKSRSMIAMNEICFHCFESVISFFIDVLGIYTYIIDFLMQDFNFTVSFY